MTSAPTLSPAHRPALRTGALLASVVVFVIPIIVLAGWATGNETLKRIQPGLVAMNPVTALCFMASAIALWLLCEPPHPTRCRIAQGLGTLIALVGALSLGAILLGLNGIDQVLFHDKLGIGSATPNRMSPTTALDFILMGCALFLTDAETRKGTRPAQVLALVAAWLGVLAIIGYVYGTTSLYQIQTYIPMALHTALSFLVLAAGFLCVRPERGLTGRFMGQSAGGAMMRRMLSVIIGIPTVLGWLISTFVGIRNPAFAFALFVVLVMVTFTLMAWANALSLDQQEEAREKANEQLRQTHAGLEARVTERTADLASVLAEIAAGISVLGVSAGEIAHFSTLLAAGAADTAAAVTQTTATVEEIRQTSRLASDKAQHVADSAQTAARISREGKQSTESVGAGMEHIQQQMDSIVYGMTRLSEQSRAIAALVAMVEDLSQQSNLLAVNAAIEAAKAGESGKGFAVVAGEVKHLADQSRQATAQVRTMLTDIQRATGAAVMATEQGGKAVATGVVQSAQTGESIELLAQSIAEAAQAAMQIAASARQQLAGMDQVAIAMEHVEDASTQNADSARKLEEAAHSLNELGQRLQHLVQQYQD